MKYISLTCLLPCLIATFSLSQSNFILSVGQISEIVAPARSSNDDGKPQVRIFDQYGKLPLSFEENVGQTDRRVKFFSRTGDYSLFLTGDEAVFALRSKSAIPEKATIGASALQPSSDDGRFDVLRMKLRNANTTSKVTGMDKLAGTSNYFIGNDPAKWRTSVPTYLKVKYEGIYSGIDLVYYGNERQLEYDFIVAPRADPRCIALDISGAKQVRTDAKGELVFKMKSSQAEIKWHKPFVYQDNNGLRQQIAARYAITNTSVITFDIAKYDTSKPLYIDPLVYSTYLGGGGNDAGYGIAVDGAGNVYVIGTTGSSNFPTTSTAFQTKCGKVDSCGQQPDAFVTKINAAGSALVYSTYLGGTQYDAGFGIAVDGAGNAYVTGDTRSSDFPTKNAIQSSLKVYSNAFVTKINPSGSDLVYSTYLGGGDDSGQSIAVDTAGNAYITGYTHGGFPLKNPIQPTIGGSNVYNAFVTKINSTGSALVYSTYLGGNGGYNKGDFGYGIAVDGAGNAYVTGQTDSTNFPTKNPIQAANGGGFTSACLYCDAFVTKINSKGSAFVYSTYLGGKGIDAGYAIAADGTGNAYVVGMTASSNFPTKNALQPKYALGGGDAFVTKINPTGSAFIYSTFLGGAVMDSGYGIALDHAGDVYIVGATNSTNFPTKNALQPHNAGNNDAFVAELNPSGSALVYSTYLGGSANDFGRGIAVDSGGGVHVTGYTVSKNFPTVHALQASNAGGTDAFIAKIAAAGTEPTISIVSSSNSSEVGQLLTFAASVTQDDNSEAMGTVTFYDGVTVIGTVPLTGGIGSLTTSNLTHGTHSITAIYRRNANLADSFSATLTQTVK